MRIQLWVVLTLAFIMTVILIIGCSTENDLYGIYYHQHPHIHKDDNDTVWVHYHGQYHGFQDEAIENPDATERELRRIHITNYGLNATHTDFDNHDNCP